MLVKRREITAGDLRGDAEDLCDVRREAGGMPVADEPTDARLEHRDIAHRLVLHSLEYNVFFNALETVQGRRAPAIADGPDGTGLVLYMVVAWQIERLMRLGRTCGVLDASLFFPC